MKVKIIEMQKLDLGNLKGKERIAAAKKFTTEQARKIALAFWEPFPAPNEREVGNVINETTPHMLAAAMLIGAAHGSDDVTDEEMAEAGATMLGCAVAVKAAVFLLQDWLQPEDRVAALQMALVKAMEMLEDLDEFDLFGREGVTH